MIHFTQAIGRGKESFWFPMQSMPGYESGKGGLSEYSNHNFAHSPATEKN